jgi:SAM-dependent methyltransferase
VIRYALVAAAAKGFSLTPQTRAAYRRIGNVVETMRRVRAGLPDRYLDRAVALSELVAAHEPVVSGDRVLEVGTGWVHFESIIVRLLADVRPTMFDVVDIRLWPVFHRYLVDLREVLPQLNIPEGRRGAAGELVDRLLATSSFEEAYQVLGAEYYMDKDASLAGLESEYFGLVVSADTLEHVESGILPGVIEETYRLLRPGGYAIHQIDLADHLSYFDPAMPAKNYLRYAPTTWERWVNSTVQYVNRVQRQEWDDIFNEANFEIVECKVIPEPLRGITVHSAYALSPEDAEATLLRYVLRRPPISPSSN